MRLQNKVALISGGAKGMGAVEAKLFAKEGAKVVIGDVLETEGKQIEAEINETGGECLFVPLDVTDENQWNEAVAATLGRFGKLDILINNAGLTRDQLAMRMSDEDWQTVLDVNLTAAFRLSRACLRGMMKKRWGRIIGITSIVGVTGNPGQVNYAASKAAMIGLAKSLAQEVASRGITVNCVAPGFIETPMTDGLKDDQKENLLGRIPAGRLGSPDDIAGACVYLAADEASYITGQTLHVNGGMAMI